MPVLLVLHIAVPAAVRALTPHMHATVRSALQHKSTRLYSVKVPPSGETVTLAKKQFALHSCKKSGLSKKAVALHSCKQSGLSKKGRAPAHLWDHVICQERNEV
jgi:hypothetical protein